MNILLLNTRDIAHPASGGAEIYTHEICKRWVRWGHNVTIFSAEFPGGTKKEYIEGIEVIRRGRFPFVYLFVKYIYKKQLQGRYDIVIDEYTLRPFLSPKFVSEPVIFFVHELAREKYFQALPPLFSHLAYYILEPRWLAAYRNIKTIAVSKSSRQDLLNFGFNDVSIVPVGLSSQPCPAIPKKEEAPTLLYVGMLKRLNLVEDAIIAFKKINAIIPQSQLWVVGRGADRKRLEKIADGNKKIIFFGFVSESIKLDLMRRAHVLVVPAIREGWGMVVTEANACGTPAVGYEVPGLRDSIRNGVTGITTASNPEALALAVLEIFNKPLLRNYLSKNALDWSSNFCWDNSAAAFLDIIKEEILTSKGSKLF